MVDDTPRPYLLGLNNPQSLEERHVLYPHDENSAGYRLWDMVRSTRPITKEDWLALTQRHNLLRCTTLPPGWRGLAAQRAGALAPLIRGRVVVLLGNDVAAAVGHAAPPFVWDGSWITIPHPSGRNRAYNDPVTRLAVSVLMWDILVHCGKVNIESVDYFAGVARALTVAR